MSSIIYKYWPLAASALAMITALLIEAKLDYLEFSPVNKDNFTETLHRKEKKTETLLEEISHEINKSGLFHFIENSGRDYFEIYEKEKIVILVYKDDSLKYWNSNVVPEQSLERITEQKEPLLLTGNAVYATIRKKSADITLAGLILVKNDYLFENQFLLNSYNDDFRPGQEVKLGLDSEKGFPVRNRKGEYLFSLMPPDPPVSGKSFTRLCAVLYFISFAFILLLIYKSFKILNIRSQTGINTWFAIVVAFLILLRWMMLKYGFPEIFSAFTLFAPHHYAKSFAFPSLGDLLINAVLLFYISLLFSKYFFVSTTGGTNPPYFRNLVVIILLKSFLILIFLYFHYLFTGLIINSSIQLEVHNFFYLNLYSFLAYLAIAFLFASFLMFADRIVCIASKLAGLRDFVFISLIISACGVLIYYASGYTLSIFSAFFYLAVLGYIFYIRYYKSRFSYPNLVLIVFIVSLFTLYFVTDKSREKENNIRKVLVVNLANERDQIAEFLLEDVEQRLASDTLLEDMLGSMDYDEFELFDYLDVNYFNSFFRKYDMQVAACAPDFDLYLESTHELVDCYEFFEDMIYNYGIRINPESDFFFLDNFNNQISYLGSISFQYDHYPYEKTVYVSLDSRLITEHLGYPELLIEGELTRHPAIRNYSYAKYHKNNLITRHGDFPYALESKYHTDEEKAFTFMESDGYCHLIYRLDEDNSIILSKPETKTINILTSFSYNFIFFFTLLGISILIYNLPLKRSQFRLSLKSRIQLSMISILLLSLVIVGAGTIYYNIRQFENKQYENITEKIQSVTVELETEFGMEKELPPEMSDYITGMLIDLSNVFYTDINLYNLEGKLYASSRPEIFELELTGEIMDPYAYSSMVIEKNPRFVHKEAIGKLSYLSAYVPFTNVDNKVLAYLNLPYFTRQSDLQKEIYTLVVAVVNIYALLILITIVIAIFISNQITKPLKLLQDKLRKIKLEQSNEQINYRGDDEIGNLVKDYNRMVTELETSAELLAKSEREGAWREMARQIAHEIKNPLTPMKLSVQHLQRAKEDKTPRWEEVFDRTCKSLIEEIENLSAIATEFSNFATMPKASPQKTDIVKQLKNALELFVNYDNIEFVTDFRDHSNIPVYMDKKQLNRAFLNLIKNAIQSIPKNEKGEIKIETDTDNDKVTVKITDTGQGVPEQMKDKMFRPNFTTKSGGMGLGLAITKNIIENSGGEIWFETETGKGSTFCFRLPVFKEE